MEGLFAKQGPERVMSRQERMNMLFLLFVEREKWLVSK